MYSEDDQEKLKSIDFNLLRKFNGVTAMEVALRNSNKLIMLFLYSIFDR